MKRGSERIRRNTARGKQKAYEAARRAWRESHPLVAGSNWAPPPGHPREAEWKAREDNP
jgi:hypothetical protein